MVHRLKHTLLTFAAFVSLVLAPMSAEAAYEQLYCNQGVVGGGQLYYADIGSQEGACQYQGIQHIFSQVICDFTVIINEVLGKVYCAIQYSIETTLAVLLTLYIAIFGAQILMGTTRLTANEIVVRLFKIAGVWTFATQSAWGIGLAFQFFMSVASQGAMWVLTPVLPQVAQTAGDIMPIYGYIDELVYTAVTGPFTQANEKLIGFFFVMAYAFPPVFAMIAYWFWTTLVMLAETLISFMLAISAVAFLIALSPIFLSFMLFQATYHFFESWLRYMMSFTLQIIIVFAVFAMWIAVIKSFVGFFNDLSQVIFPYNKVEVVSPIYDPNSTWGICKYSYGNNMYGPTVSCVASECGGPYDPDSCLADKTNMKPPTKIIEEGPFLYYLMYHLIALLLIAYAFGTLLKDAFNLSRELVGPAYSPILGPGWGAQSGYDGGIRRPGRRLYRQQDGGSGSSFFGQAGNAISGLVDSAKQQVSSRPTIK